MTNWKLTIEEYLQKNEKIPFPDQANAREWVYNKWSSYKKRFINLTWQQRLDFFRDFIRWLWPEEDYGVGDEIVAIVYKSPKKK